MAKQKRVQESDVAEDWQRKRPEQGYAYADVLAEVHRRAKGEYVMTPEGRDDARDTALHRLEIQYKLSALLSDFLRREDIPSHALIAILDCNASDTINFALDPFPCGAKEPPPIENDTLVDLLYPGKFFTFDRT